MAESPATNLILPAAAFPGYNKRLLISILLGNIAVFQLYSAYAGILLPSMVQAADPANKVANLAIVSGISAIFATVFNPLGGAWSDRTRSRWGRRTPWLIGAALAMLLGSIFLGLQTTIAGILIGWCLVQGTGNIFQAAITAVIPDRVPPEKRGTASAVAGLGPTIGGLFGLAIAGAFIQTPWIAAGFAGLLLVAAALLFIILAPEKSDLAPAESIQANNRQTIGSFFSSLSHHNFRYVFISRLFMMLGFFAVQGYFYYLLQDYIPIENYGLRADQGVLIMTLVSTAGSLISIILGGSISDRTGRRKNLVIWSAIFIALTMAIPRIYPTWPVLLLFCGLLGLGFGLYLTVSTALVTLVLPKTDNYARDMGIFNMANSIPLILAPFISAFLITSVGGYASLFVWGVLLSILAALAILPVKGVK